MARRLHDLLFGRGSAGEPQRRPPSRLHEGRGFLLDSARQHDQHERHGHLHGRLLDLRRGSLRARPDDGRPAHDRSDGRSRRRRHGRRPRCGPHHDDGGLHAGRHPARSGGPHCRRRPYSRHDPYVHQRGRRRGLGRHRHAS